MIVYLAGRYRGTSRWRPIRALQVVRNIAVAWWYAWRLARRGVFVVSPHCNSALMDHAAPALHWLMGDLEVIRRLARNGPDEFGLAVLPHSWSSQGTAAETALAAILGCRVAPVREWLEEGKP